MPRVDLNGVGLKDGVILHLRTHSGEEFYQTGIHFALMAND